MKQLSALALLPHIRIQNANMISGPLTWGFPAMTAFLGAVHRIFRDMDFPVRPAGVGIVCHAFLPQASGPGYVRRPFLRRFPVNRDGSSASLVEEGRAHLEVSLVLGMTGEPEADTNGQALAEAILERLQGVPVAGGLVLPCRFRPCWETLPDAVSEQSAVFHRFRRRLLPGFALVERRDFLLEHLEQMRETHSEASSLEALLDLCRINWEVSQEPENPERGMWTVRERGGWFVPVPVGFRALSPLYPPGSVRNARDRETPFRFVESVYTLGEWKSPHRLDSLREFLWRYQANEEEGLYLCTQTQGDQ